MKKSLKIAIASIFIILSGAYAIYYMLLPIEVEGITIESILFQEIVKEDGKAISQNELYITSLITDKVEKVYVNDGDFVKKGDVLVEIDDTIYQSQLDQLLIQRESLVIQKETSNSQYDGSIENQRLAMESARLSMETFKTLLNNSESLYSQGAISESEYKMAADSYDQAINLYNQQKSAYYSLLNEDSLVNGNEKDVMILDSQIEIAKKSVDNCTIIAGMDGYLTSFSVKEGQLISPQISVGKIIDSENYYIESYLVSEDTLDLKVEDQINIRIVVDGYDENFLGTIKMISPVAEDVISSLGLVEQRVKVLSVPNEKINDIKIGSNFELGFIVSQREDSMIIPKSSLLNIEDKDYVYVVEGDRARLTEVETGLESDGEIVINKGLENGDIVVKNYKSGYVKDGDKVKLIE